MSNLSVGLRFVSGTALALALFTTGCAVDPGDVSADEANTRSQSEALLPSDAVPPEDTTVACSSTLKPDLKPVGMKITRNIAYDPSVNWCNGLLAQYPNKYGCARYSAWVTYKNVGTCTAKASVVKVDRLEVTASGNAYALDPGEMRSVPVVLQDVPIPADRPSWTAAYDDKYIDTNGLYFGYTATMDATSLLPESNETNNEQVFWCYEVSADTAYCRVW